MASDWDAPTPCDTPSEGEGKFIFEFSAAELEYLKHLGFERSLICSTRWVLPAAGAESRAFVELTPEGVVLTTYGIDPRAPSKKSKAGTMELIPLLVRAMVAGDL